MAVKALLVERPLSDDRIAHLESHAGDDPASVLTGRNLDLTDGKTLILHGNGHDVARAIRARSGCTITASGSTLLGIWVRLRHGANKISVGGLAVQTAIAAVTARGSERRNLGQRFLSQADAILTSQDRTIVQIWGFQDGAHEADTVVANGSTCAVIGTSVKELIAKGRSLKYMDRKERQRFEDE